MLLTEAFEKHVADAGVRKRLLVISGPLLLTPGL